MKNILNAIDNNSTIGWLVFAGLVLLLVLLFVVRRWIRQAKEYPEDTELSDKVDMYLMREALKRKLDKIEKDREFKDRSNLTEDDIEFIEHISIH